MEAVGLYLREFLQNLVFGPNSPRHFKNSVEKQQYIREQRKSVGNDLFIHWELVYDDLDEIEDYKVIFDSAEMHGSFKRILRSNPFITEVDLKKDNKEESWKTKRHKSSLYSFIIGNRNINELDVRSRKEVFYGNTYKLEIQFYNQLFSEYSHHEIMYMYYEVYLEKELDGLLQKLSQFFEPEYIKKHNEILNFYAIKLKELCFSVGSQEEKKVYLLILKKLNELKLNLNQNVKTSSKIASNTTKLQWNGSEKEFFNFFDPLIESGVLFSKNNSPSFIYSLLLQNFQFSDDLEKSIVQLLERKYKFNSEEMKGVEHIKIGFKGTAFEFAVNFDGLIVKESPTKSKLLLNNSPARNPIVRFLYKIFYIGLADNFKEPIEEITLIQAFKDLPK